MVTLFLRQASVAVRAFLLFASSLLLSALVLFGLSPAYWQFYPWLTLTSQIVSLGSLAYVFTQQRGQPHNKQSAWGLLALAQVAAVFKTLVVLLAPNDLTLVFGSELAFYLLFIIGVLWLPTLPATPSTRLRMALDTAASMLLAGLILSLATRLVPNLQDPNAQGWFYYIAVPIAELGLLFATTLALLRQTQRSPALWLVLGSGVMHVLTEATHGFVTPAITSTAFAVDHIGYMLLHLTLTLAGLVEISPLARASLRGPEPTLPQRQYPFYLPYVVLVIAYVLLISGSWLTQLNILVLGIWVGGITALILLRQIISLSENRQLLQAEQKHRATDTLLLDFSRQLLMAADEASVLRHTTTSALAASGGDLSYIALVAADNKLQVRAQQGLLPPELTLLELPLQAGSQEGYALLQKQIITIAQYTLPQPFQITPPWDQLGYQSGLSVPILTPKQPLGVLTVLSRAPQHFTEEASDLLALLVNQTAAVLEKLTVFQLAKRQLEELSVLRAVAVAGTEATNEDALIQRCVGLISSAFPTAAQVNVFLYNEATGQLVLHPFSQAAVTAPDFITPLGKGLTGQVALDGKPRRVGNTQLEPNYIQLHAETQSELCVPLKVGDRVLGVLDIEHTQLDAFAEADERLLLTIAQQFALAIEKLRLLVAEKRRVAALTGLHAIGLDLTAQIELPTLLHTIVERAALMLEAPYGSMYLWQPERQQLEILVNYNLGRSLDNLALRLGEGLTGRVAAAGEPILINDYQAWPGRLPVIETPLRSAIGLPIRWHGQLLGVFNIGDGRPHRFGMVDIELATLFSDQAAVAIANGQLYAETQRRLREQTLLFEISQEFSQVPEVSAVFAVVAERMVRWLKVNGLGCYLYDETSFTLQLEYEYNPVTTIARQPNRDSLTLATMPTLAAALSMRIPRVLRLSEEWLSPTERTFIQKRQAQTTIVIPMALHDQVIGCIEVWDDQPDRTYGDPDQRLLLAFATQAAVAVQNARLFQAEQQRAAELEAVRQAGLALTASLDLEFVLKAILQSSFRLLPEAHEGFIFLHHTETSTLTFGAALNRTGKPSEIWAPRPQGLTHTVAKQGKIIAVPNMQYDPLFADNASDWGGAIVGLPLKIGERVVGVMNVVYPEPRVFPEWELRVLRLLGDQAAITIENARLFTGERMARAQAEALREVAATLNTSLDREGLLSLMLGQLSRVVSYDSASVMLLTNSSTLAIVASDGFHAENQRHLQLKTDLQHHLAEVLETRHPVIIADTQQDNRWQALPEADYIRCWLGVPLVAQGRVIGLLNLDKKQVGFYTPRDADMAVAFANQAAVALENARLFEAERRQLRLAQTLQAVGALLTAQTSLSEVFETIFRLLAQVVQYDSVSVQLMGEDGHMHLAAGRNFPNWEQAQRNVLQISQQREPKAWLEHQVVVIPDTAQDPRWVKLEGGTAIRSWIGAALIVKGDLVGILATDSATPNAYDAATGETVRAFANQAAVAIVNARLFDDLQRQTRTFTSLYNTALAIGNVLEPDILFRRLYDQVQQLLNVDTFVLLLYRPESEILEVAFAIENGHTITHDLPFHPLPISEGLTGWIVRHRQSLLVNDILAAENLPALPRHDTLDTRAWLGVPLIVRDRIIGAISVQSFKPNAFKDADLRFMESIASQAAIAIENARLFDEVSARVEELSRLYAAAQDLSATLEPRAVLQKLATHLTEAVSATSGYVIEVDWPARTMTVRAEYWSKTASEPERKSDLDVSYAMDDYPNVRNAIAAQATTVLQGDDSALGPLEREQYRFYSVHSVLIVPILARGQTLGFAEIWESRRRRDYTEAERRLLQTLCQHASSSLENARLFAETARHAEEVTTATTILHILNTTDDIRQAFQRIVPHLKAIAACDRVAIAMLDGQRQKMTLWTMDRPREEPASGSQMPIYATAAAADILAGQMHLTPDLSAEIQFPNEKALYDTGYRSRANLPLRAGDRIIGALNLIWNMIGGYAEVNLPLLSQIAEAIALATEKSRLFEETRRRDVLLEALAYAGERLLLPGDLRTILPDVLAHLGEAAQASRAYIFEQYEADHQPISRLVIAWASLGQSSHNMPYLVLSNLERWAQTLQAGRSLTGLVREFPQEERVMLEGYNILSIVVVPIFRGNQVWGFLGFDDTQQERVWSAAEVEALKSAAGALGAALIRQQSEAAEREQRTLAEALRDTAAALNSTLDQDEVLDRLLADVGRVVPHDAANIMLIENGMARVVRSRDTREGFLPVHPSAGLRYVVEEVLNLREILETGQPVIVSDTHTYPGWFAYPETEWIRCNVGAPIRIKGQTIGFIILDSISPDFFTQDHADRLQAFAHQAGVAIEHAQLYEAVLRHADELEQRVTERTKELAEANVRLRELDRLKDEFISNVSHELRTPLTNIKLHLSLVDKRGAEALPRHLPILIRETERLRRLIEDLLDLSRLQTSGFVLQREPVLIDNLIDDVIALHVARAEARSLELHHARAPVDLMVQIDRAKMTQVFTNLVGNAVAYTPSGGKILVSSITGNTSAQIGLQFHNDGPPIPPEDLPHLFDRFYRGRTGRDSGEPGTGLGLAICREIVERHGGRIEVISNGNGTTFTVWLPMQF